jgi:release factor glutamine methyltransferase
MNLMERLSGARAVLVAAGHEPASAAVDVDVLAREVLGWDRAQLLARGRDPIPASFEPAFSLWVERRVAQEPVAYITGRRDFWTLTFLVTPAVLIPRPETELIVEEALAFLERYPQARVADIGTGSGCLALAIAHEARASRVVGTDVSRDALRVACRNARRLGVGNRVMFVHTRYLTGVSGQFDLIVSNPPYIPLPEATTLSGDVRREPRVALFGGIDGLRDLRRVVELAAQRLRPGGVAIVEFGAGQEEALRGIVAAQAAMRFVRIRRDLQGIPRTLVIERSTGGEDPLDALDS